MYYILNFNIFKYILFFFAQLEYFSLSNIVDYYDGQYYYFTMEEIMSNDISNIPWTNSQRVIYVKIAKSRLKDLKMFFSKFKNSITAHDKKIIKNEIKNERTRIKDFEHTEYL